MITGPNGAGKSSLFRYAAMGSCAFDSDLNPRLIGELWPPHRHDNAKSRMMKPKKRDIVFVPQKPYLVLGTLRDQIIYPHSEEDMKVRLWTNEFVRSFVNE
jgi:ABC-type uncharacterized transport system fused permease/ATPase subunit